jgi:heat shock protein HslJ
MAREQRARWSVIGLVAVALVAVASCGDDDDDDGAATTESTPVSTPDAAADRSDVEADLVGATFVASEVTGWTLVDGTELTISFDADLVVAEAGCNSMRGGWSVVDGALQVETLSTTLIGCTDELQRQDEWLAAFLEGGPAVALDGDVLMLTTADATVTAPRQA